jgi:RNA polymerase sigma-70 factor (ECF subfamily)
MRAVETDVELLTRLREGDEHAFIVLVGRYQESMLRVARSFVQSRAVAEEAVQETWIGVVKGIERFEGRSSLKTWLFSILVNRAQSAGSREHKHADVERESEFRFTADGAWSDPVERWVDESDDRLDAAAWSPFLKAALDKLTPRQRQVVLLRDMEGLSGNEVSSLLGISSGNQRLLLHRGRNQLRDTLDAAMRKD